MRLGVSKQCGWIKGVWHSSIQSDGDAGMRRWLSDMKKTESRSHTLSVFLSHTPLHTHTHTNDVGGLCDTPWGEGLPCHHTTCCLKGHGRKRKAWRLQLRSNLKYVKMFFSVPTSSRLAVASPPPVLFHVWKSVQTLSANRDGPTQTHCFERLTLAQELRMRQTHRWYWLKMRTLVPGESSRSPDQLLEWTNHFFWCLTSCIHLFLINFYPSPNSKLWHPLQKHEKLVTGVEVAPHVCRDPLVESHTRTHTTVCAHTSVAHRWCSARRSSPGDTGTSRPCRFRAWCREGCKHAGRSLLPSSLPRSDRPRPCTRRGFRSPLSTPLTKEK